MSSLIAGLVQPERLGERVGEDAGEAVVRQRALDQRRHAQGLRGHPDRLAAGAAHQVVGVGVEGVEVDHGDRGRRRLGERGDGGVEPRPQAVAVDEVGRSLDAPLAAASPRCRPSRRRSGEPPVGARTRRGGASGSWCRAAGRAGRPRRRPAPRASWRSRMKPLTTNSTTARPARPTPHPRADVEDEAGGPVGDRAGDLDDHLERPGQPGGGREQGEAQRAQAVGRTRGGGTRSTSRWHPRR